ncbi:MAG: CHAT domain-containing protein [Calditrichaeota bacterium]|nr:CHAT domain-containing protein [Calditrichota bacterium]
MIGKMIKNFFQCLFLCFFVLGPGRGSGTEITHRPAVALQFYQLVSSLENAPVDSSVQRLNRFLQKHPDYAPCYKKIFEFFLIKNDLNGAIDFFNSLSKNERYKINSYRMLGNSWAYLGKLDSARFYFNLYFSRVPAPDVDAIEEFVTQFFRFENSHKLLSQFKTFQLPPSYQKIAEIFIDFHSAKYTYVIEKIKELPSEFANELSLIRAYGKSFFRLKQMNKADSVFTRGLKLAELCQDFEEKAEFLTNFGMVQFYQHNVDTALALLDSAYEISVHFSDYYHQQRTAGNLGYILRIKGDYEKSIKFSQKAASLALSIFREDFAAAWYYNLASAFIQRGRYYDALVNFDKCSNVALQVKRSDIFNRALISKGDLLIYLNLEELAKELLGNFAIDSLKFRDPFYRLSAKVRLSDLTEQTEINQNVEIIYNRFFDSLRKRNQRISAAFWTGKLASKYRENKQLKKSKKLYLQAMKESQEAGYENYEYWYLLDIANIEIASDEIGSALNRLKKIIVFASEKEDNNLLLQAYSHIGQAFFEIGDLDSAIQNFAQSIELIEQEKEHLQVDQLRIGYLSKRYEVYRKLVECYFRKYEQSGKESFIDSTFLILERGRARELYEMKFLTREDKSPENAPQLKHSIEEFSQVQNKLRDQMCGFSPAKSASEMITEFQAARYSLLNSYLHSKTDSSGNAMSGKNFLQSFSKMSSHFNKSGVGILIYYLNKNVSFVLAGSNGNIQAIRLKTSEEKIGAAVEKLMESFHLPFDLSGDQEFPIFDASLAHDLYKQLIAPVERKISLPEQLLIIPDSYLSLLPFELLLTAEPRMKQYRLEDFPDYTPYFLIQKHKICYAPSLAIISEDHKMIPAKPEFSIFSNPCSFLRTEPVPGSFRKKISQYTGWSFSPLPFSDFEAKKISEIYPRARIFRREKATEEQLFRQLADQDILHISTHGFADLKFDIFSGLILAKGENSLNDGILQSYEINQVKVNPRLVVLSACETGRGKNVDGEGVLGLPRMFLGKGAAAVLMTLWKVEDRFTSELMIRFYNNLLHSEKNVTNALADAKLALLKDVRSIDGVYYQHPFFWAPFCLYGEPILQVEKKKTPLLLLGLGALISVLFAAWMGRKTLRKFK